MKGEGFITGIIIIWIIGVFVASILAGLKNRSAGGWALGTVLLSPLLVLILLILPSIEKKNIQKAIEQIPEKESTKQIPEKEPIIKEFQPKCPTCGSPDVEKITAANKVKNAALWGVFALGQLSKTYKCNNCNYKW